MFILRVLALSFLLVVSSYAADFNPVEKEIDGIKIYYAEDEFLPIISVNIAIKNVGTAYVDSDLEGINSMVSYLANNLLFLGEDRKDFGRNIAKRNIGISFNGNLEDFYITLKFMPKDTQLITEVLTRFFYRFEIDSENLEMAKQYIIHSRDNSYLDSNFVSYRNFTNNFFDNRYSRDGFISDENYSKIDEQKVKDHMARFLNKQRVRIAIAGAISEDQVGKFIKSVFGDFDNQDKIDFYPAKIVGKANQLYQLEGYDQVVFFSGIKGIDRKSEDFYTFYILNHLIGGSARSSMIGERLREDEGLTYSGYSFVNYHSDVGFMVLSFACDKAKYTRAKAVVDKLLSDIKVTEFSEEELNIAKQYLMGKYDISFSSNARIAGFMLGLLLNDLPVSMLKDRNNFIEAVTLTDIYRVRDQLFNGNDFVTVITGDVE